MTVDNTISLLINNNKFSGWERVRIERSMETLSGACSLTVTDHWIDGKKLPPINPGDQCAVLIGPDVVVTGYVDEVNFSLDANEHTIEVTGRDLTGDLVDCSVLANTRQNGTLEQIVGALIAGFKGIGLQTLVPTGEAFSGFAIDQGETVFEAIQRLCKLRAVLAMSDGKGNLVITTAGTKVAATALVQGKNIKGVRFTNSWKDRFSIVYAKGQTQGNDHLEASVATQGAGIASDSEINRFRPLMVIAESKATTSNCQDRATWEVATRMGKGNKATVQVQGWRQKNGALWDLNTLTQVVAPAVNLTRQMLISGVIYNLDNQNGSTTDITLVRPEAFRLIREIEKDTQGD